MIYLKFSSSLKYTQWRVCSHSHEAASKLSVVVQSFSCVRLRDPRDCSVLASPCCPSSSPRVCPSSYPLSRWCHPSISSSVVPFSSHPQCFPTSGFFLRSWLFASGGQVLEFQLQHQSLQWIFRIGFLWDWLVWSPCSPRGSEESSPTPQFKSINSLVLSFLYGPTLTSIHDYWKKITSLTRQNLVGKVMSAF